MKIVSRPSRVKATMYLTQDEAVSLFGADPLKLLVEHRRADLKKTGSRYVLTASPQGSITCYCGVFPNKDVPFYLFRVPYTKFDIDPSAKAMFKPVVISTPGRLSFKLPRRAEKLLYEKQHA